MINHDYIIMWHQVGVARREKNRVRSQVLVHELAHGWQLVVSTTRKSKKIQSGIPSKQTAV